MKIKHHIVLLFAGGIYPQTPCTDEAADQDPHHVFTHLKASAVLTGSSIETIKTRKNKMLNKTKTLRTLRASLITILIMAASFTYVTAQASDTPESRAKDFYTWYLTAMVKKKDPTKDKIATKAHLSIRFNGWYYSKAGQAVDTDAFLGSQEWNDAWADNIEVGEAVITGNKAVLKVMLSAPPDEYVMTLEVRLVKEGGKWKIDRVKEVIAPSSGGRMA